MRWGFALSLSMGLLSLELVACNPLGSHYEEKATKETGAAAHEEERDKAEPKELLRAAECKQCHSSIYDEWKSSMHSKSTAEGDPLFALAKKVAVEHLSQRSADQQCRKCHYADWSSKVEAKGGAPAGVTCTVCHKIAVGHPEKKLASGEVAELARGDGAPQALCLSCHAGTEFNGQPLCVSGIREESDQGKCVDCHMGVADGPGVSARRDQTSHRGHDFSGGHSPRFLRGGARISMARDGREVVVTVKHGRAAHSVPNGHPFRHIVVVVEQVDKAGKVVASNAESDLSPPLGKTPVFMQIFSNDVGARPVHPFQGSGKPLDTRLQPGDVKEMRVKIAARATEVRARLEYYLAPRGVLKEAGMSTDPAIMSQAELSL